MVREVKSRSQLPLSSLLISKNRVPSRLSKILKRFSRQTRHYRLRPSMLLMSVKVDCQYQLSAMQLHEKQIPFR
jgi:hypothetical protein